jgi:uncharacterized protein YbaP (TraB family)
MYGDMKNLTKIALNVLLISALFACSIVRAETSVWRVSKNGNELYLGGTIHFLSRDDFPLPCEFDYAYEQASEIIFETDLSVEGDPVFQQNLLRSLVYSNNGSLEKKIKPNTLRNLEAYMDSINVPLANVLRFKPGMLLVVATGAEMQKNNLTTYGVDKHYFYKAKDDKKITRQLESIEEQIAFISEIGVNKEDEFIAYLLESMPKFAELFSSTKREWLEGDMEGLYKVSETEKMRSQFKDIFDTLLTNRNNAWMPKIESMLKNSDIEYVLVGAGHMTSDVGLLSQLMKKGYQIEQIDSCLVRK